ncbi:MAG: hypothetical protein ACK4IY_10305, partial [Chitinophagales bacterium]
MIRANDPQITSWIHTDAKNDFPIQNLPFGIFRTNGKHPRVGVAIGKFVLDVFEVYKEGWLDAFDLTDSILENYFLNDFIKLGKIKTSEIRNAIAALLWSGDNRLQNREDAFTRFLHEQKNVQLLLPVNAGDYTDFYSSEVHATNVGKMFRPDNPLL